MQLIVLTGIIIILCGGIMLSFDQLVIAKSNHNEEKQKSDSTQTKQEDKSDNTGAATATTTTSSDIIPIPSETTPLTPTTTTTTCDSSGATNTNPECAAAAQVTALTQKQIALNEQKLSQQRIDIANQKVIDQIKSIGEDSGTSGSGSSSSSSNNDESTNEDQNFISDKNLGTDSRFILIAQDGKIDLFFIQSDEKGLDTGILPKLIHPVTSFDNTMDAMQWINQYDNRSN